jgi:hypothetical protein
MNLLVHNSAFGIGIGATLLGSLIFTGPIPSVRADDDWEDRREDYQDWLEDEREEAEDRWEDREEAIEEWREDRGRRWRRLRKRGVVAGPYSYRSYLPRPAYEELPPPAPYRDSEYHGAPAYREYYPGGSHVYRYRYRKPYAWESPYRGHVQAGPVRVDYGRRGAVHVGPFSVYWD